MGLPSVTARRPTSRNKAIKMGISHIFLYYRSDDMDFRRVSWLGRILVLGTSMRWRRGSMTAIVSKKMKHPSNEISENKFDDNSFEPLRRSKDKFPIDPLAPPGQSATRCAGLYAVQSVRNRRLRKWIPWRPWARSLAGGIPLNGIRGAICS